MRANGVKATVGLLPSPDVFKKGYRSPYYCRADSQQQQHYRVCCEHKSSLDAMTRLCHSESDFGKVETHSQSVAFNQVVESIKKEYIRPFKEYRTMQGTLGGTAPGNFPTGYTAAPMKWEYFDQTIDTQMNAGFFACAQNPKTFAIEPVIGWSVSEGEFSCDGGDMNLLIKKK